MSGRGEGRGGGDCDGGGSGGRDGKDERGNGGIFPASASAVDHGPGAICCFVVVGVAVVGVGC